MKTILTTLLTALACLIFMLKVPDFMLSPGKLSAGHQQGSNSCLDCHTAFKGAPDVKCWECHDPEQIGVVNAGGEKLPNAKRHMAIFHMQVSTKNCSYCHTIHMQTSKTQSGAVFGHENLAKTLRDNCGACHEKPEDNIHKISHVKCYGCHNENEWKPASFSHDDFFRFDNQHKDNCVECHTEGNYNTYSCYGCHEHSERKIREEHREHGMVDFQNCTECHRSGDEHEAERKWNALRRKSSGQNLNRGTKKRRTKKTSRYRHENDGDEEDGHDDD